MTEKEAKNNFCPIMSGPPMVRCLASQCMMWRFEREVQHVDLAGRWNDKLDALFKAGFFRFTFDPTDPNAVVERETKHGYCGLVDKP